jgi:hypothetical protein
MNNQQTFHKWGGIFAITAGILALLSLIIGLAGVNYDFDVFSDTSSLIAAGASAAGFIRWSYWMNMAGNYLFLAPLALILHHALQENNPLFSQFYTLNGLLYILMGAAGSAILAASWPYLMTEFATASANQQAILTADFQLVNAIAETGLHGIIQNLGGLVWFLGMGSLLRSKRNGLGLFAMVIGGFLVLNTLGNMFNIEALSLLGLMANILLSPIWSIWIGTLLVRTNAL